VPNAFWTSKRAYQECAHRLTTPAHKAKGEMKIEAWKRINSKNSRKIPTHLIASHQMNLNLNLNLAPNPLPNRNLSPNRTLS
jgi:hypothetical protein